MFMFLGHTVLFVVIVIALILAAVLYFSLAARAKAKLIAEQDLQAAQAEALKVGTAIVTAVEKVEAKL